MSRAFEFLKDCGVFFVLTVNGSFPAGRPFGALMERDGRLYISTGDEKAVYRQLREHPQMQLVALKAGTRAWCRVSGIAGECTDLSVKQAMLEACPVLQKRFSSADAPHFAVFGIDVTDAEIHKD